MINRIRAKLHSSSGASMAIALLFLLLCLTVGAVVLTAAASNAGRMSHSRESQQDYLTVSSAARLLRDELEGLTYATGEERIVDGGPDGGTSSDYLNAMPDSGTLTGLVRSLAEQMFRDQTDYVSRTGEPPGDKTLTVTAAGFDGVSATLSMDAGYNLAFMCRLTDDSDSYPMTVSIPAQVMDQTVTTSYADNYTVWEEVEGVLTEVTYTYTVTTTTRTVTVTWDDGVISKGG
ncbi:MAG: hypothetical protein EOM52_00410 [Clostridia bacterium]|nr:hypothetical protein [Clostridia bacterium]